MSTIVPKIGWWAWQEVRSPIGGCFHNVVGWGVGFEKLVLICVEHSVGLASAGGKKILGGGGWVGFARRKKTARIGRR